MKKLKNTTSNTGFLDNRDNLFSMLVALARRNQGELRFTLDDIDEVKSSDAVGILFDKKSCELILRVLESGVTSTGSFMVH